MNINNTIYKKEIAIKKLKDSELILERYKEFVHSIYKLFDKKIDVDLIQKYFKENIDSSNEKQKTFFLTNTENKDNLRSKDPIKDFQEMLAKIEEKNFDLIYNL